ncbi:uncharacterized protein A1O9_05897 [Exophiala aquamarina CBS 119918]|uniref:Uncharacterized protein n=1 Tax=Exophiala aquamarina CBS 119918 TaxID=1182545 RepID=A0A072PD02_9EURO|nr:uncharacterized protein A1O9_05897 [Exophiala aquamarina CBS 119918]KEF57974.1 hypothetical protein A1O9_05897 [Exophiala aquamarina CBS 119918]
MTRYSPNLQRFSLALTATQWLPEFATYRYGLDYWNENRPYIGTRRHVPPDATGIGLSMPNPQDTDDTDIAFFMQDPEDADDLTLSPEAQRVVDVYRGKTGQSMRPDEAEDEKCPYVAWLDERACENAVSSSRKYRGPLTSHDLGRELQKPRYRQRKGRVRLRSGVAGDSNSSLGGPIEPDADRRLIFITDLNSPSIHALISTASTTQASALRDALAKHLAFEPLIEVRIETHGPSRFELCFHLPVLLCRASETIDHRRHENGKPLRRTSDISFLNLEPGRPKEFLYEAEVSCVIAGLHDHSWIAYCFVDTYFDSSNERRETIYEYHKDKVAEAGMNMDPLTYGNCDAEDPIWDPRLYFLEVCFQRTAPTVREWKHLVGKVEGSFRNYDQTYRSTLPLRASFDWVTKFMCLSAQLQEVLVKIVDMCDNFCSTYPAIFEHVPHEYEKLLNKMHEFRTLKRRFGFLSDRCAKEAHILELKLIDEALRESRGQSQLAMDNKRFSLVMLLYISPIALAQGIFSTEKPIVPLVRPTFPWFAGLILIFSVGGFIVHTALFWVQWGTFLHFLHACGPDLMVLPRIRRRMRKSQDIEGTGADMPDGVAQSDAQIVSSSDTQNSPVTSPKLGVIQPQ